MVWTYVFGFAVFSSFIQLPVYATEVEDTLKAILGKLGNIEATLAAQNERLGNLEKRVTKSEKQQSENFVAFTAHYSSNANLGNQVVAIYDTAATNYPAGAYDTTSGKFTCPVSGLYFFGTTTFSTESHCILQLVKEGTGMTSSFADAEHHDQGSNVWITQCNAGEEVWTIQVNPAGCNLVYTLHTGEVLHSFGGFLITQSV